MNNPPVSVIVPLKGNAPALADGLRSILSQDYPNYEILFVTESSNDPAVPIVNELIREKSVVSCRHVVAGAATACSQKNHNLLAGNRESDPARTILVFCDGGHVAPSPWLGKLVAPIIRGEAEVSTGYHRIAASPFTMISAGMAAIVSALRFAQGTNALRQPWGGSTAITRALFERLRVADLWSQHVVDDVSLARKLKMKNIPTAWAAEAILQTPIRDLSMNQWTDWLSRQLFFLRVYYPWTWLLGGLVCHLFLLVPLLGVVGLAAGLLSWPTALACLVPAAIICWLALQSRTVHPNPGAVGTWLAGGWLAMFMTCVCHLRTACMRRLEWSGIRYEVAGDGRVTSLAMKRQMF